MTIHVWGLKLYRHGTFQQYMQTDTAEKQADRQRSRQRGRRTGRQAGVPLQYDEQVEPGEEDGEGPGLPLPVEGTGEEKGNGEQEWCHVQAPLKRVLAVEEVTTLLWQANITHYIYYSVLQGTILSTIFYNKTVVCVGLFKTRLLQPFSGCPKWLLFKLHERVCGEGGGGRARASERT